MFEEIVGISRSLKAVLSRIAKVAPTNSTVLITGETGTGKELIARAVHKRSQRSGCPFVSVNCAALPLTLVSSELFGHQKGAFTGATQRRLGRFELADGGTDEVGELLPDTQVALLRVLQEREFERVGEGSRSMSTSASSLPDLKAAVANGTFRQDLFYRLNVFHIEVPPFRATFFQLMNCGFRQLLQRRLGLDWQRLTASVSRGTNGRLSRRHWLRPEGGFQDR